ncbi:class I SAM-dependent methyltransferase [Paenibacillus glycinis]|uniref:Methyltransferase domain-containing protein n=1 Tax=Paenibacillus glycinis TaxID=2697035 RepID=A0ABW9XIA2_9BACL|nr:class I SAM-dependent methyltransferase [Paenibacillus glycinis]NBD22337.1 methyltransferase domain-containing protein [Paenibacillus glycinis]
MDRITYIREQEKAYHDACYREHGLFEPGSWLHKPVRTVMELMAEFEGREDLRVLDLGCGIGRNSIPIAEALIGRRSTVVGVDLLDSAVAQLAAYSRKFGVASIIRPVLSSIEAFEIEPGRYDYIVAVSTLEHLASLEALDAKLAEMVRGTKAGGVHCLVVGTGIGEKDADTGEALEPLFEINLATTELLALFDKHYAGWEMLARTVKPLVFDIDRQGRPVILASDCVTLAAKRPIG